MSQSIEAIFLDVGNTLRIVIPDPDFQTKARQDLMRLVGCQETEEIFFQKLNENWKRYRSTSKKTLVEASERELWSKWLLPEYPEAVIAPLAGKLTRLWRDHDGRRVPREDAKAVVLELSRRGYVLGIIANTITETEIPDWIDADGLNGYFKTVILSSKVAIRKPNPQIYLDAAKAIGVPPERCVYVGDNPVRDVEGAQAAGFGMSIIIIEPDTLKKEAPTADIKPDHYIRTLSDLLEIFPPR